MANKKINELDTRTGAALTDLILIGDPTSGTSFKLTATDFKTLLNNVPYTGAISNVNLGEFGISGGYFQADLTPTMTGGVGRLIWNDTDGTMDLGLKGGNVTLHIGQNQYARVVNGTGGAVTKAAYRAVKITGAQGQRLQVNLAQANNDANSTDTLGVIAEDIANNQTGFICTSGQITGINTTGSLQGETWNDGDILYLSPTTPGVLTKIKPDAPNHSVIVGFVIYAHANNGKIFIKVDNGYESGELHDIYTPVKNNNDGIFWVSANNRYESKSVAGALGYTPISGTGVTGQIAYWNGTNSQTGSNNLFWNSANNRLGINTNTPTASLQVVGTIKATNVGTPLLFSEVSDDLQLGTQGGTTGFTIKSSSRNVLLYSGVLPGDGGQRLQVYGDTFLKGTGATSATSALSIQDSGGVQLFRVRNDNKVIVSNLLFGTDAPDIFPTANGAFDNNGGSLTIRASQTNYGVASYNIYLNHVYSGRVNTSGTSGGILQTLGFSPTSGTGIFNQLRLTGTINQTGGANGISRGVYVDPILTAAADWRSIEWSNNTGWGLYGAGTAPNFLGGSLTINDSSIYAIKLTNNKRIAGHDGSGGSEITLNLAAIIAGYSSLDIRTQLGGNITFQTNGANTRMQVFGATGNVVLQNGGTFVDGGQRLQVQGDAFIKGSGSTDATNALIVQNSAGSAALSIRNDRVTIINNAGLINGNLMFGATYSPGSYATISASGSMISINGVNNAPALKVTTGVIADYFPNNGTILELSSNINSSSISVVNGFGITGQIGNGVATTTSVNLFRITTTINQGAGTTITRGIYVNPTITNVNDWRAIEVSAGVSVLAPSTTASATLRIPSGTAPTTPTNGDIWFDGTDLKMRIGGVTKTFTLV